MSSKRHANTRSSFAQSFFQSGSDLNDDQTSDDGSPNFPVPRSRPLTRRASTRRSLILRRSTSDSLSTNAAEAAAAVAAEAFDSGDDERNSWYADALRQQSESEMDLKEFLTDVNDPDVVDGFGDKEVLEQYRIMAQCEARLRVKENIGFDMDEYEETHKLSNSENTDKRELYGVTKKPKFRLPEPKRTCPESTKLTTEAPPFLPPRPDPKLVQQKCKRVPELQTGTLSRGDAISPAGQHTVRCLGCRSSLQVNQRASLVRCPECSVISPASSTRR